ncbi:transposase InsO family protein [Peribacillus sp. B2I2]|uniref:IS3 family transposase n=1 Tax=Peribacillus sp. B2I2 TaxID=3156468 RepID=UPI0035134266
MLLFLIPKEIFSEEKIEVSIGDIEHEEIKNLLQLLDQESPTPLVLSITVQPNIDYYNNKHIKQKLAGMSPVEYRLHTSQLTALYKL